MHQRTFEQQFTRAGVDADWFGEKVERPIAPPRRMVARMRDPRWLARWYELALSTIPRSIESMRAALRSFRPDVLCVDPLNVAAATVAPRESEDVAYLVPT